MRDLKGTFVLTVKANTAFARAHTGYEAVETYCKNQGCQQARMERDEGDQSLFKIVDPSEQLVLDLLQQGVAIAPQLDV